MPVLNIHSDVSCHYRTIPVFPKRSPSRNLTLVSSVTEETSFFLGQVIDQQLSVSGSGQSLGLDGSDTQTVSPHVPRKVKQGTHISSGEGAGPL